MQSGIIAPVSVIGHNKLPHKSQIVFWTYIGMAEHFHLNAIQKESLIKILNEPLHDPLDLGSLKERLARILDLFGIDSEDVFMCVYEEINHLVWVRNRASSN